jgi:hypothetical protein
VKSLHAMIGELMLENESRNAEREAITPAGEHSMSAAAASLRRALPETDPDASKLEPEPGAAASR